MTNNPHIGKALTESLPKKFAHASLDKAYCQRSSIEIEELKKSGIRLPDNRKGVDHTLNVFVVEYPVIEDLNTVLRYKEVQDILRLKGVELYSNNILSFAVYESRDLKAGKVKTIHYKIELNLEKCIDKISRKDIYEIDFNGNILSKETDLESIYSEQGIMQSAIFYFYDKTKSFTLNELAAIANINLCEKDVSFTALEGKIGIPESVEEFKYIINIK